MKITKEQLIKIIKEEVEEAKLRLLHDADVAAAAAEEMPMSDEDDDADFGIDADAMDYDEMSDEMGDDEMHANMQHDEEQEMHHGEDDMDHHQLEMRMAKSELYKLAQNAQALCDMVDNVDELPAWVQSKIATAADRLDAVYHYMAYDKGRE